MQTKVHTVMTKSLITIPVGSPLSTAFDLMKEKRFRHLPVVDGDGHIVGIISQRDLNYLKDPARIPVEYMMSTPVVCVDQYTPLRSGIFRMLELKISSLLITGQGGDAIGIVTTDDLLWYLSYLLEDPKENHFSFSSLFDLQTVGEAARQISLMGI